MFYFGWLAVALTAMRMRGPVLEFIWWLAAPVATGAGFATGVVLASRLVGGSRDRPYATFVWCVLGCAIGAGAVCWLGPMLIVFGMFAAGTASVVLREVFLRVKTRDRVQ